MSRWYRRDGSPTDDVSEAFGGDRHVGYDEVGEFRVSTVHLGLDHQYGDGPPLIFETMVFPLGSYSDVYCDRYSTEEEAAAGHAAVVAKVKAGTLETYAVTLQPAEDGEPYEFDPADAYEPDDPKRRAFP